MKRKIFFLTLFFLLATVVYKLFFASFDISLTVSNNTPYHLKYAYGYSLSNEEYHVKGWLQLGPGESRIHTETVKDDRSKFLIRAMTLQDEEALLRWVYDIEEEVSVSMEFTDTASEENLFLKIFEKDFDHHAFTSNVFQEGLKAFASVPINKDGKADFVFQDPDMTSLFCDPNGDYFKDELRARIEFAPLLRSSLERQMWFHKQFPNPDEDYPFVLANLEDDNGYHTQGVKVSSLYREITIKGGNFPLLPGDHIMGMEQPILSGSDLYAQLYMHGTSLAKGIEKPITFHIIRDGKAYAVECTYFFNENFSEFVGNDKFKAGGYGFLNSISYGLGPGGIAISKQLYVGIKNLFSEEKEEMPDFKKEKWIETQKEYQLRQMYSDAFNKGSFVGIWVSPAQILTKSTAKVIAKAGLSRTASKIVAAAAVESAEGAVFGYNDAPVLFTDKEQMKSATAAIPESFGIGVIIGSVIAM